MGPRTEPQGTPMILGHFVEDFPSRTKQKCLLLKNEEIRLKNGPDFPYNLSL